MFLILYIYIYIYIYILILNLKHLKYVKERGECNHYFDFDFDNQLKLYSSTPCSTKVYFEHK